MLVLTRKLNQQIRLGDDITITILRVRGNTIRLGIEAPRSTRVVRGELPLHEAMDEEPAPGAGSSRGGASATLSAKRQVTSPAANRRDPLASAARTDRPSKPLAGFVGVRVADQSVPVLS